MSTITDTSLTPVSFTAGAIEEIQRLMHAPDFDQQQRLRVGVKGGGCSVTGDQRKRVSKEDDEDGNTRQHATPEGTKSQNREGKEKEHDER